MKNRVLSFCLAGITAVGMLGSTVVMADSAVVGCGHGVG